MFPHGCKQLLNCCSFSQSVSHKDFRFRYCSGSVPRQLEDRCRTEQTDRTKNFGSIWGILCEFLTVGLFWLFFWVILQDMEDDPANLMCEICLKPQSSAAGLKQHIRRIHKKVPLVPIQCIQCEKLLRDEHTLKCHIKAVHGSRNYSCPYDECKKSFSAIGILNAHLRTHSDEKIYDCEICGISYKDRGYYIKHLNKHLSLGSRWRKYGRFSFWKKLSKFHFQLLDIKPH